ncbi:MAG TPA: adenylate/guanylate cyclase domain-containing protein [Beijerinckiaceae bacterium]|nr:adenylate/guanylate cyclase domain-containing protein [Beijerinckiaceae bacterium]
MSRRGWRRHLATVIAACAAGLWGAFLAAPHLAGDTSLLERLEAPLTDLRFLLQGERPTPDIVTIVAIDDNTVRQAGAYPLPRAALAQLIERITSLGAKAIALDLLLVDPGPEAADEALASALRAAPVVIAAAGTFNSALQSLPRVEGSGLPGAPAADHLLLPQPRFAEAAAVGTVNLATDRGGTPRYLSLVLQADSGVAVSLPLRAASLAVGRDPALEPDGVVVGGRKISTDHGYRLPLRFYGSRGAVPTIGAAHVLAGRVHDDALRGRVVLVGATVTGGGDVFPTPFDPILPGVEVLATATAHLLVGDSLVRDWRVRGIDAAVAVSLPVLLVLLLAWHRTIVGFAVIGFVVLLWVGVATAAFVNGVWLSATLPIVAAVPPAVIFGAARLLADRRRADSLEIESGTLRRFQPPSLADRLARDPAFLKEPVRQLAAVVFVDLSGFTGLSETLGPSDTRTLLKTFHTLVDEEAVRGNGLVAAFMGDGAMILFGLPDPSDEDPCHAVRACVGLSARTVAWLQSLPPPIAARLGFKIGAHFGMIVASRLGGGSHEHITAIGDTVNVASRLMEVAADHSVVLALSDQLYQAAGAACEVLEAGALTGMHDVHIRGRAGTVRVWLWSGAATEHAAMRPPAVTSMRPA